MNAVAKLFVASAMFVALLSGCALGQIGAVMHPTVAGTISVRAADGTETRLALDRCKSGDWNYFLGFDFFSSQGDSQLRAIQEPTGSVIVRWTSPQGSTTTFRTDNCAQLELDVQPTVWRVNDVREFTGRLELRCQTADGTSIAGRLTVDHCH